MEKITNILKITFKYREYIMGAIILLLSLGLFGTYHNLKNCKSNHDSNYTYYNDIVNGLNGTITVNEHKIDSLTIIAEQLAQDLYDSKSKSGVIKYKIINNRVTPKPDPPVDSAVKFLKKFAEDEGRIQ